MQEQDSGTMKIAKIEQHGIEERIEMITMSLRIMPIGMLKAGKINTKGPDGQPLTCHCCGSFRHFVIDCPDSWENIEKGSSEEDEHSVLFVRNRQTDDTQWRACLNTYKLTRKRNASSMVTLYQ